MKLKEPQSRKQVKNVREDLVYVDLSTRIIPDPDEPDDYCQDFSGAITVINADTSETKVGTMSVTVVRLERTLNKGDLSAHEVLDARADLDELCCLISDNFEWSEALNEHGGAGFGLDLLVIDRVRVDEAFRGRGLGLIAAFGAIHTFRSGCGVAALKPYPLQYRKPESEWSDTEKAKFPKDLERLANYWSCLGLSHITEDIMAIPLGLRLPNLSEVLWAASQRIPAIGNDVRQPGRTEAVQAAARIAPAKAPGRCRVPKRGLPATGARAHGRRRTGRSPDLDPRHGPGGER